jgi:hypothetical protein
MTGVVQHDSSFVTDQKAPVASDAVVEPGLAPKQRAIGQRAYGKLVPKGRRAPLRAGESVSPKSHEKALRHFSDQTEKRRINGEN